MIKRQIEPLSTEKCNCMQIPHSLPFQITCLQTLAGKKVAFPCFHFLYWTFKFMVTSSSINSFKYFFCQGIQVLQGPFIKTNVIYSNFDLVK